MFGHFTTLWMKGLTEDETNCYTGLRYVQKDFRESILKTNSKCKCLHCYCKTYWVNVIIKFIYGAGKLIVI